MDKKEENVKINFFKKVWYSITKFEQYPEMAMEGLKRAIKYLIILTAIVSVFVMIGSLIQVKNMIEGFAQYVDENIPEFSYANGKLSMQIEESIIIEETQNTGIDKIIINTLVENNEEKDQLEEENIEFGTTLFFFTDKIVLNVKGENDEVVKQEYTYKEFITSYTGQEIETFNKVEFVEFLTSDKMSTFYQTYAISIFGYLLIVNIMIALLDSLEIAILGWITTTIARIRMKFVAIYNMAVYALTLPMILNILYIVINYFTDFTIKYFQVAYITIAYIYLAATIFILKDDFIKKMQEVEKIKQEQLKVRDEIKQEKTKKEEPEEESEQEEKGSLENGQG